MTQIAPPYYAFDLATDFHWSIERYLHAIATGTLDENDRVELIFGKIIEKMPIYSPHSACITKLQRFFRKLDDRYLLRTENPVILPNDSMPEPDGAVVAYQDDLYASYHPTNKETYLIIEAADSSLDRDRTIKMIAYALAGIPEYWIVNIRDRRLEVHLSPDAANGTYMNVNHYGEDATVNSPFAAAVRVADLLPAVSKAQS